MELKRTFDIPSFANTTKNYNFADQLKPRSLAYRECHAKVFWPLHRFFFSLSFKCHREEAIIIRRVIENDAFHDERIGSLKMPTIIFFTLLGL